MKKFLFIAALLIGTLSIAQTDISGTWIVDGNASNTITFSDNGTMNMSGAPVTVKYTYEQQSGDTALDLDMSQNGMKLIFKCLINTDNSERLVIYMATVPNGDRPTAMPPEEDGQVMVLTRN